jgi:tetratricopeptide (TPR) repeat protein
VGTFALFLAAVIATVPPLPQAIEEKERGDRLAANGDLVGAREAYQNAAKLSPGYAAPLNELGILLVNEGKSEEALESFRKSIAADSSFALAQNNLGFTLRKLGRFSEAIEAYKTYLSLDPSDAAGVYGLAEAHKGAGDKSNALAAYRRYLAADQDPKNQKRIERARATAGVLARELGEEFAASSPAAVPSAPSTSAPAAVTGASSPPSALPAAASTATAAAAPAQSTAASTPEAPAPTAGGVLMPPSPERAAANFSPIVSPEKAALAKKRVLEGTNLRQEGKTRESLFALREAAQIDPSNPEAMMELGVAYALLNYYPQAIVQWQRVLAMPIDEGQRAAALKNIESATEKMKGIAAPAAGATGDRPEGASLSGNATALAASATPLVAGDAREAYTKGVELYSQQRYREAIGYFDKALQGSPDFSQAFSARGSAYFALKEYPRALSDFSQAMRLDNTMASPLFGVAETLFAMGRSTDSVPYYRAYAESQAPDAQSAFRDIARRRLAEIGK